MYLPDLIKEGIETISSGYPEREAREMVLAYLEHRIGTSRHTHIIEPCYMVDDLDLADIREAFSRMAAGEPLQYVMKKAYFYGREFKVSPDVLIPRPETEILCRHVIDTFKGTRGLKILDLCTGSGCIAWTLALELQEPQVTGVDISDVALAVARSQSFAQDNTEKPSFIKADILAPASEAGFNMDIQFDIVVSNPPYVTESEKTLMRTNVLDYEPHLALFVPDDDPLLFYRAVAEWSMMHLRRGGFGMVEINESLASETEGIFRSSLFTAVSTVKDLNDKDRFVIFRKR